MGVSEYVFVSSQWLCLSLCLSIRWSFGTRSRPGDGRRCDACGRNLSEESIPSPPQEPLLDTRRPLHRRQNLKASRLPLPNSSSPAPPYLWIFGSRKRVFDGAFSLVVKSSDVLNAICRDEYGRYMLWAEKKKKNGPTQWMLMSRLILSCRSSDWLNKYLFLYTCMYLCVHY